MKRLLVATWTVKTILDESKGNEKNVLTWEMEEKGLCYIIAELCHTIMWKAELATGKLNF